MTKNHLMAGVTTLCLSLFLTACATPDPALNYDHANAAIRAAQVAGAETYAPDAYSIAQRNFQKASTLMANNRQERAQKLLEIAIAQADLARAISEAEHAETALEHLQVRN